ncbi:hypothetical protein FF2_016271 [Malus domestica]
MLADYIQAHSERKWSNVPKQADAGKILVEDFREMSLSEFLDTDFAKPSNAFGFGMCDVMSYEVILEGEYGYGFW